METTLEVIESTQVAQVRRHAVEIGRRLGLSEEDQGRAALVATEICTNLVKYGQQGQVTLSPFFDEGALGVQLVAVDRGPGISDFAAAARDGHSTGGSLGIGLGAIMRASDLFESYTATAQGSAFLARIARGRAAPKPAQGRLVLGARRMAMLGEIECGDAWAHATAGAWERVCVVDGLGHGPLAAIASTAAIEAFHAAAPTDTPVEILARCHAALGPTRGAVMGVAAIDMEAQRLYFAGVGNISAMVHFAGSAHHLLSTEGIVGHRIRNVRVAERPWGAGAALVMSSDGLSGRWSLERYPGLVPHHPVLVASVLFRDFARNTDDATVVVAKDVR